METLLTTNATRNGGLAKGLKAKSISISHENKYIQKRSFMISTRALRGAILAALVFSFYPQQLQAEALRNKDFLTWSEGQQAWWLHGAATMAGHIALLRDGDQATCMWNWYFDDMDKKRALVVESARKYPDSTPTAILIALLQRACGKFVPDDPKESK